MAFSAESVRFGTLADHTARAITSRRHAGARCALDLSRFLLSCRAHRQEEAMGARTATTGSPNEPHASHAKSARSPLELWRARGATDDLRALAIETSFGY